MQMNFRLISFVDLVARMATAGLSRILSDFPGAGDFPGWGWFCFSKPTQPPILATRTKLLYTSHFWV
jgi:hypothetical protein